MRKDIFKQSALALMMAGSLIVLGATANAQGRRDRDYRDYGPVEATGNIDRNKNGIDDRYEAYGQVDLNQNGIPDSWEGYHQDGPNRGHYSNDGYYGNSGYYGNRGANDGYNGNWGNRGYYGNRGYDNVDLQRGYSDGLSRGRDDAL